LGPVGPLQDLLRHFPEVKQANSFSKSFSRVPSDSFFLFTSFERRRLLPRKIYGFFRGPCRKDVSFRNLPSAFRSVLRSMTHPVRRPRDFSRIFVRRLMKVAQISPRAPFRASSSRLEYEVPAKSLSDPLAEILPRMRKSPSGAHHHPLLSRTLAMGEFCWPASPYFGFSSVRAPPLSRLITISDEVPGTITRSLYRAFLSPYYVSGRSVGTMCFRGVFDPPTTFCFLFAAPLIAVLSWEERPLP